MEKVLLFRVGDAEAAVTANLLAAMKIRCERIPEGAFGQTIGELAAGKISRPGGGTEQAQGAEPGQTVGSGHGNASAESLMVFCDVSEKHFSRTLALLRERAVRIDYKAVLTPVNREWNVLRLYAELARERAEYERMKG